jgi:predicted Zn-dependent protease
VTPQEIVERALSLSNADGCVVIVDDVSTANLRWAANTLTTNGVMQSRSVTVIAVVNGTHGADGASAGVVSRSRVTTETLEELVRDAEQAARQNGPAEDARPLVDSRESNDWQAPPEPTCISVFSDLSPALGETFAQWRHAGRFLYGYVEHDMTTTYVGSSTGLRLRHVQPTGQIAITAKTPDLSASAWVGQATRDFTDIDVTALDDELVRRLSWTARPIDLPAGRYETLLPPSSVADLMIYAYWEMAARDAHEGRTVYARPGAGTRVGEQLSTRPVSLYSDPAYPRLECASFVIAHASSSHASVFDNGLPLTPTQWIREGSLAALIQTRHSADLTDLAVTPGIGNLVVETGSSVASIDDLVASTSRGLLLTSLWYIRAVDPQTLLLTGLTRDGVYLVEQGEVVGVVNNFRFNESPIDLLDRYTDSTATAPTFSREWGDYFPRVAMPALRVPDFNMSSVSEAL